MQQELMAIRAELLVPGHLSTHKPRQGSSPAGLPPSLLPALEEEMRRDAEGSKAGAGLCASLPALGFLGVQGWLLSPCPPSPATR